MNVSNFSGLTVRVEDYNMVAERPDFLAQLRFLTIDPWSGMNCELTRFEEIRRERRVQAEIITAYQGELLVGWAFVSAELSDFCFHRCEGFDPQHGLLFEVFVHPNHRRQGIASELIKAAKHRAGDRSLCVCPHDDSSTGFYNRFYHFNNKWL